MKILVINGPNLDKLHLRDKSVYSDFSLEGVNNLIKTEFPNIDFVFSQTNSESELVKIIHESFRNFNGIIFNPGAYSHNSIAIRDAMEICKIPIVEVHLSNISNRETFRNVMITAAKSSGYISGFRENSYLLAVYALIKLTENIKI
jgi:3-dehydroquinate dehydratase-2